QLAYREFYTKEHCADILKRLPRVHYWLMFWNLIWYRYSGVFSGTHPMMTGFFRQKDRLDRRPGRPTEGRFRFAWRWIKDFVLDSRSYIKLFFEFREIWYLTRPQAEKRERRILSLPKYSIYSPLAYLRVNWNSLQQKVAEHCWRGSYEDAKRELTAMLSATAEKLRQAKCSIAAKMPRRKKKLSSIETVVQEIENCLHELEKAPSNPSVLFKTEEFVREHILPKYEELTSRFVRLRRKANEWRESATDCLEQGRVFRSGLKLVRRPWLAIVESYLSFRFFIACFRKELEK
ncbi:MAG: hypothetical protein FWE67_07350, partial [Planctomycetaceae bacterium]|nr:hypothetical protein [Planctomycetaceae bacterium]